MRTLNHCRLCRKSNYDSVEDLIKYGTRHYVHGSCAIKQWGPKLFERIADHQLGKLPYLALEDAGLLDEVMRRHNAAKREGTA